MSKTEEAVRTLTDLGLTEYEARCFVALTRIETGTAREISEVAEVPRSRVYDTIERLEQKGLVTVQHSDPREYRATSVETACDRIRDDYDSRINAAENALRQIDRPESTETEGMWAITRNEYVTDRVVALVEDAEVSIHLVVVADDVIDRRTREALRTAAERGVDVFVEVPTEQRRDEFRDAVSDATVVVAADLETSNAVYDELPAKLLMADQESVIATGIKEGDLPSVVHETAVWTYGHDHGFAVWMRELLDDRATNRNADQ